MVSGIYIAMSKVPLQYLVISIGISSQIIVQLSFSLYYSFLAEKVSLIIRFSAVFWQKTKKIIFDLPVLWIQAQTEVI